MCINRDFFLQPTPEVAKKLLGKILVSYKHGQLTAGIIVETEAYLGLHDPGSHSYRGETHRTRAMFGEPGHAYIYFIYGMHVCINAVTSPKGVGEGVLIRALEPIIGVDVMKERRKKSDLHELCSGPAKLTQALGIEMSDYGVDLAGSERLQVTDRFKEYASRPPSQDVITQGKRIGLTKGADLLYRYYINDSSFVSKK